MPCPEPPRSRNDNKNGHSGENRLFWPNGRSSSMSGNGSVLDFMREHAYSARENSSVDSSFSFFGKSFINNFIKFIWIEVVALYLSGNYAAIFKIFFNFIANYIGSPNNYMPAQNNNDSHNNNFKYYNSRRELRSDFSQKKKYHILFNTMTNNILSCKRNHNSNNITNGQCGNHPNANYNTAASNYNCNYNKTIIKITANINLSRNSKFINGIVRAFVANSPLYKK